MADPSAPSAANPRPDLSASTASSFVLADAASPAATLPPQTPQRQAQQPYDENENAIDDDGELDSLPSISTSVLSPSDDDLSVTSSDAQREWEESLEQLQLLLTMVLVPFAGKFVGRKIAYWSWARYMEWAYDVDVRWTNNKAFDAAGAVGVAATL